MTTGDDHVSDIVAGGSAANQQETAKDTGLDGRFDGRRSTVFWMQLRYVLLPVLTLGIYRFWAKTKTRQYFWSHAEIAGDRLEYLGSAKELLIGFLIALAILLPLSGIGVAAETLFATSPETAGLLATLGSLGVLLFIQVALYRMWRYRLTRTAWRGIRFGMDGSTLAFAGMSILYFVLTSFTLGLAFPWMRVALARYRINNARFGDRHFQCDATGGSLFLPWLIVYLTLGIGYVWYLVREFNTIVSHTRFGDSEIATRVRAAPVYGWAVLMLAILAGGFVFVFILQNSSLDFMVRTAAHHPEAVTTVFFGVWFVGGLLLLVAAWVMIVAFVLFEVAKQACNSLQVNDIAVFEAAAAQSGALEPTHGEGLADALDVGAF